MAELSFEWDDRKDAINRRKHGVSFAEAQTVFFDEEALSISRESRRLSNVRDERRLKWEGPRSVVGAWVFTMKADTLHCRA